MPYQVSEFVLKQVVRQYKTPVNFQEFTNTMFLVKVIDNYYKYK
ncbi:MAG: hypothetical protein ACTJGD_03150 [Mesonia hippocampi]